MIGIESGVEALIFDCDGTLADTLPLHHRAWWAATRTSSEEISADFLFSVAGTPDEALVEILNDTFGYRFDPARTAAAKDAWFLAHLSESRPIVPVLNVVQAYRGRLPMAVASGSSRPAVEAILEAAGLTAVFDTVVTAEDVARPKPAPDPFVEAARRLKVLPKYCQVFEDSDLGLEAARRAGMIATDVRPVLNRGRRPKSE